MEVASKGCLITVASSRGFRTWAIGRQFVVPIEKTRNLIRLSLVGSLPSSENKPRLVLSDSSRFRSPRCSGASGKPLWGKDSRRRSNLLELKSGLNSTLSTFPTSTGIDGTDCSDWNLEGWKVVLKDTGEEVGHVEEVLQISQGNSSSYEYYMLKVVDTNSPGIEVLVPWVEDIVKEVDSSCRCVVIKPPDGLLELARRPEVLRQIRVGLQEFGLHTEEDYEDSLARSSRSGLSDFMDQGQVEAYMPTRHQLQSAGEHKLVEMIMSAGGFPSVAQALGFRAKRRPVGFWDVEGRTLAVVMEDLQNVDAEIETFVSESWREEVNSNTGTVCYVNLVTHEVLFEKPATTTVMDPIPVSQIISDTGTAVMPRMRTLREAGRYDLHHAIMMHGGYKDVAQQLGRQVVSKVGSKSTLKILEAEVVQFMQERGLSIFPSLAELRAQNRADIIAALRKHGGVIAVADYMGIRTQRNGKGHWTSVGEAGEAMRKYMLQKLLESRPDIIANGSSVDDAAEILWAEASKKGCLQLPTQAALRADGRKDLRYVLQKYGQHELANNLDIKITSPRGRKRGIGNSSSSSRRW